MAVGTFIKAFLPFLEALELFRHYFQVNGWDIWRSGPKRSQMGCWDMGQMAVGTFDGQEICYKGPNGC